MGVLKDVIAVVECTTASESCTESHSASKHDIPIAQVDRQAGLFDARASCLLDALHASVVHASGSGQLQANPHMADPWLSLESPPEGR